MVQFHVGDFVQWTSQANGSAFTKKGAILAVVPEGRWPKDVLAQAQRTYEGVLDSSPMDAGGRPRTHESYLVRVQQPMGRYQKVPSAEKVYWPRISQLKPVQDTP